MSNDYSVKHQELCGACASELRQLANRLDAGEIDCVMFFAIGKDMGAKYSLVDGKYFMAFESYVRNFINRFGREAIEKALFPPIKLLPSSSRTTGGTKAKVRRK